MKKSLTLKMFLIIFLSLMLVITIILWGQVSYFQEFYQRKIEQNLIENIEEFTQSYKTENWSDIELYRQIDQFSIENDVHIYVEDSYLYDYMYEIPFEQIEYVSNPHYLLTILKEDNTYADVYINENTLMMAIEGIEIGDSFYLEGFMEGDELITPSKINDLEIMDNINIEIYKENNYPFISGEVKLINYKYFEDENYLWSENSNFNSDFQNTVDIYPDETIIPGGKVVNLEDGLSYTISQIPYTNEKEIKFTKNVEIDGREVTIYVNASLQPIGQAFSFLTEFYKYFYLLAAFISFILALFFSKLIAKPIVNMTSVANRMANMDFTEKANVKSKDELGTMAQSLNTLSTNLKNTMGKLKEANKKLKEDFDKKEQQEIFRKEFIANVSHELKTPLGIIRSFTESIQMGVKKEKQKYYMDVIIDETDKMDSLVMEMLELSEFDDTKSVYSLEPICINELIDETIKLFEQELAEKNMKLTKKGDFTIVLAEGDKIRRILINLISNAIKYGNENSTVRIIGSINEGLNKISIENDCEPFDDIEINEIWQRFYKGDKSRQRKHGGTGLGLSIVKSILEGHKADYGVENINDGVSFYFKLKVIDDNINEK